MNKLSIVLVDDHQLFREGLALILKTFDFAGEIYEAADSQQLLELLKSITPDIIFMDISLPDQDGIRTTREILELYPGLRVIALTMFSEGDYCTGMIEAGASGFILKNSGIDEVETSIRQVMAGKNYFSAEIMTTLAASIHSNKHKEPEIVLSDRELDILMHICKGLSNQEIAGQLHISKRTVDKHRENILSKTRARNTAALVLWTVKNGIIRIST